MQPSLIRRPSSLTEVHQLLLQAEKLETQYEWPLAAKQYEQVLNIVGENSPYSATLMERCGYAVFRSGMQASTPMEFRDNLLKAISFYRKANRTLTIGTELANVARTYRCESFVWYLRYWLTSRPSEKVAMLEKAWASARECLRQMYEAEIGYEYVVTYNQLSIIPWIRFFFSQAKKSRVESAKEAIELGQHVIESLPQVEHRAELATCYVQVSSLIGLIADIEPSDARSPVHLLRQYWKKAKELSEEAALIESSRIGGGLDYEDTMEGGIKSCERALPYVLKTGCVPASSAVTVFAEGS